MVISDSNGLIPILSNEQVFLPVRLIAELVTAAVIYDGDRNAVIETETLIIEILIGRNEIIVNDKTEILDYAPYILNDRVMVHLNVMEFWGFDKQIWDIDSTEII